MKLIAKEPINTGWSKDKKYCVTDENGTRYLLRISDIAEYDTKKSEFDMMQQVSTLGVPMCLPIEFGTCEDGVYSMIKITEDEKNMARLNGESLKQ